MNQAAWPPAPPLIAILRGLESERAAAVGRVLFDAGFRALEVPLNRPGALAGIEALAGVAPPDALMGAGTVTEVGQVDAVAAAGGALIVSPHLDTGLVAHARARGMRVVPGVFTPTEAFAALRAGADALKLFPAETLSPAGLRALLSVLPAGTLAWPVGGVTPDAMARWREAGANGFGIGGALFGPGIALEELARRAQAFVAAWTQAAPGKHGGEK
ncbi:MAG TPA: 2-dehydro-3-deoxy-6-phosphogalactonate aldolase [Burkholderiaceae bacterium]|nr:2-dehydro-3-deoxy-6-phosphogalactonate aldolase [Burkholderiaceae bacterium]